MFKNENKMFPFENPKCDWMQKIMKIFLFYFETRKSKKMFKKIKMYISFNVKCPKIW